MTGDYYHLTSLLQELTNLILSLLVSTDNHGTLGEVCQYCLGRLPSVIQGGKYDSGWPSLDPAAAV